MKHVNMYLSKYFIGVVLAFALVGCAVEDGSVSTMDGVSNPGSSALTVSASDDCATVDAWVTANAGTLPTSYEELTLFPSNYRRVIFGALSPTVKSRLWQHHLFGVLQSQPAQTAERKQAIGDAIALAGASTFQIAADADSNEASHIHQRLEDLHNRFVSLFGEDMARSLLSELGPIDVVAEADIGAPARRLSCECADASSYCHRGYECDKGYRNCKRRNRGCGTFGRYACDGVCVN